MTTSLSTRAALAVDPDRLGDHLRNGNDAATTSASGDDAPGVREPDETPETPGVREPDETPDTPGVREPDETPETPGVREPDEPAEPLGVREPDDG